MSINFISSKNSDEIRDIKIMVGSETNEIIEELFKISFEKISRRISRINERK